MSAADRATLTRLLLERGLEVSYRQDAAAPAAADASALATVVVGSFGGAVPADAASGSRVIDADGVDPAALAAAIDGGPDAAAGGREAPGSRGSRSSTTRAAPTACSA